MTELKQISPWENYCKEVEELFRNDKDITVEWDSDHYILSIYVDNHEKAEALMQLMPIEKEFGNVSMAIRVVPANQKDDGIVDLFRKAFEGNTAFSRIVEIPESMPFSPSYVMFKPEIVQYFNDDLSDANGLRTTLYQELAKDVFDEHIGIYFCTELLEDA